MTDRRGGSARHDNSPFRGFSGISRCLARMKRDEISLGSNLVNVMTTSSRSAITGLQCKDAKGGKTLTGSQALIVGAPLCPVTSCECGRTSAVRETRLTLYIP